MDALNCNCVNSMAIIIKFSRNEEIVFKYAFNRKIVILDRIKYLNNKRNNKMNGNYIKLFVSKENYFSLNEKSRLNHCCLP